MRKLVYRYGYIRLLLVIPLVLSMTGCWDQKIYEKLGFILDVGIDLAEDDRMFVTFSSPVIEPVQNSKEGGSGHKVEINKAKVNLVREGREIARLTSPWLLEAGKLQNIIFGKDAAAKGMHLTLKYSSGTSTIPSRPGC